MKTHPIHIARNSYRGTDPKKRAKAISENRDAVLLEDYVNQLLLKQQAPIQVYSWMEISQGCGLTYNTVERLGFSIDCGSNGFTAWRHDLTYEQAMEATRIPGLEPVVFQARSGSLATSDLANLAARFETK